MSSVAEFVRAAQDAASRSHSASITVDAGAAVRVELCGAAVVSALAAGLLPAAGETPQPVAELFCFESAESGVDPPAPPWPVGAFSSQRQELPGFTEPPRIASYDVQHATMSYWDEESATGVQWFRDTGGMMPAEPGAPMRNLLRWSLAARGAHMLHLAAAGGVLFGGPGGAGKSTSSLACALAGAPFTSDDFSVVTFEPRPTVHAVYSCVKATDPTLELLPGLEDFGRPVGRDWRDKLRLDARERITRTQPVHAVVLPRLAARTGTPRPIAPGAALAHLTGGSLPVMICGMRRTLAAMRELLERLPVYSLDVGPDVERIPAAVAEIAPVGSAA